MCSGLARSVFWDDFHWQIYDVFIHLPVGGISSGTSNLIIVSAAFDRLKYLKNPNPRNPPPLCTKSAARKMILLSAFISCMANLPYFFIYTIDSNFLIRTTPFFRSSFYHFHNWVRFIMTGMFPAIFVCVANGYMISVIKKWSKCELMKKTCSTRGRERCSRAQDQLRLTSTLVAVVFLFIVGEIPTYMASRQSAISILYGGDMTQSNSAQLQNFRVYATLVNTIHISFNIIIYATLNPAYLKELDEFLKGICGRFEKKVITEVTSNNEEQGSTRTRDESDNTRRDNCENSQARC